MILEPPSLRGGIQCRSTEDLVQSEILGVGGEGGATGDRQGPGPAALRAQTLNRYCEPSMSPLTVKLSPIPIGRIGSRVTRVQRFPPVSGDGGPSIFLSSSQLTVMASSVTPLTFGFSTCPGALREEGGTFNITHYIQSLATSGSLSRGSPTPNLFCAMMRKMYSCPAIRFSTVQTRSLGSLVTITQHIEPHLCGGLPDAVGGDQGVESGVGSVPLLDEERAAVVAHHLVDVLIVRDLHPLLGVVGGRFVPGLVLQQDGSHGAGGPALAHLVVGHHPELVLITLRQVLHPVREMAPRLTLLIFSLVGGSGGSAHKGGY
ncbi:hypothetical protein F7725_002697 [Dissostichus mawsoni]|uniref:Uncharacterized protein n=1 Tax=Dissostichus mawsoni TaxID=36200 RepID=A0A7J5Y694_DISMA|nr:hypothetical protein F7725_002697 [Dissostichus mawsoni]